VEHRYDVGRRGERALVLLTRFSGGDLLYSSILKTIDAISFQKAALNPKYVHPGPQKWFLNRVFEEHQKLCQNFLRTPQVERKPMLMSVGSIEVGEKPLRFLNHVDTSYYLVPTSLLVKTPTVEALANSPILPLLRVLGVSSTLRLLSALLSENRVLLLSANPTRLAQCARSALSILAQGLLNWQHLYIPVLPPHLFQYLGAPVPYLIGMLSSFLPKLNEFKSDGLGEIVIINLDTKQMETRGMDSNDVVRKIPDLFQKANSDMGAPLSSTSVSEMLAQDLVDLLKADKRVQYGESTLTNVTETAAKAKQAMKEGISSVKKFFNNRKTNIQGMDSSGNLEEEAADAVDTPELDLNSRSPDAIYIQGSRNEVAEEAARIAFSSFFLCMFGNMRWYLSASPGQLPHLDRTRFLQQKRAMGEGEYTPMWPLLQNFCQSQMFEQFAKARIEEVRLQLPLTSDSPLFTLCATEHRKQNADFSVLNVRRIAPSVARITSDEQRSIRRMAMLLTSNKTYEGDYYKAVSQLVENSRECTAFLSDVMSVIWVRMRDSKGVHWKHGLQALQVLRNLLYHGPLAAVAEATDGLEKIRAMKFYNDNMRAPICTQIRQAAHQVYNLLVDRAKLFNIRRTCMNKRRVLKQPEQARYKRDSRISVTHRFGAMHQLFHPNASTRVAPAPHSATSPHVPQAPVEHDILGLTSSPPAGPSNAPSKVNATQDIIGLFETFDVSNSSVGGSSSAPTSQVHDPFSQAPVPNAHALTPSPKTVLQNSPASNPPSSVVSQPSDPRAHNPFDQMSVVSPQPHSLVQQGPPAPLHYANRSPQVVHNHQYSGANDLSQPPTHVSTHNQKSIVATSPRPAVPQQQHYQAQPAGQYYPHHHPSGPPQHGTAPSPQQHHIQQHNPAGGYQYPPTQHQQQQLQPQHQQFRHPLPQQQFVAQPAPSGQSAKPNLSQFDPFH